METIKKLYRYVLLYENKMIDWKITFFQKDLGTWRIFYYLHDVDLNKLNLIEDIIDTNSENEVTQVFNDREWFKQFEVHEIFKGELPYEF